LFILRMRKVLMRHRARN